MYLNRKALGGIYIDGSSLTLTWDVFKFLYSVPSASFNSV